MVSPRILIVLTSFGHIPSINKPTGWYLPELAHPYKVLAPKADLVFASPKGGAAPLDPESVDVSVNDTISMDFLNTHQDVWENTVPLSAVLHNASDFDAIFYPGGSGPMWDLATDAESIQLIEEFYAAGKPVAAVCHGPVVFINTFIGPIPIVSGKRVTGVSNNEEDALNMTNALPFLLEDALKQRSGIYSRADEPFGKHVLVDGNLITGQNPASAAGVGEAIVKMLGI